MSRSSLKEDSQVESFIFSGHIQAVVHTGCSTMSERLRVVIINNTVTIVVFELQITRHQRTVTVLILNRWVQNLFKGSKLSDNFLSPTDIFVTSVRIITPIVIHIGGSRSLYIIILNSGSGEVGRHIVIEIANPVLMSHYNLESGIDVRVQIFLRHWFSENSRQWAYTGSRQTGTVSTEPVEFYGNQSSMIRRFKADIHNFRFIPSQPRVCHTYRSHAGSDSVATHDIASVSRISIQILESIEIPFITHFGIRSTDFQVIHIG